MTASDGRIVGIDHGTRRVGVAISDPLRMFAQPFGTYPPAGVPPVLKQLREREGIETLVVGWPLNADGSEGEATRRVSRFIRTLERALPGVAVVKLDERYTSELAREAIRESGARKKARKDRERVDAAAAAIILQEYLDQLTKSH